MRATAEATPYVLELIGALYGIEANIRGAPPTERLQVRQHQSLPILYAVSAWLRHRNRALPVKSELAKAINYSLSQWDALVLYCEDGLIEISNALAESTLRRVSLGSESVFFVGSGRDTQWVAAMYSVISCKVNDIDPND
nr:transposase [Paraburkholderia sp. C35]